MLSKYTEKISYAKFFQLAVCCISLMFSSCAANDKNKGAEEHPYASDISIKTPKLFLPGIVSTELPEFAISFSVDGRIVYFNVATRDRGNLKIVQSTYVKI